MDGVWAPTVDTGVTVNATGGCALVCAATGVLFGMCATRGKGVLNSLFWVAPGVTVGKGGRIVLHGTGGPCALLGGVAPVTMDNGVRNLLKVTYGKCLLLVAAAGNFIFKGAGTGMAVSTGVIGWLLAEGRKAVNPIMPQ